MKALHGFPLHIETPTHISLLYYLELMKYNLLDFTQFKPLFK